MHKQLKWSGSPLLCLVTLSSPLGEHVPSMTEQESGNILQQVLSKQPVGISLHTGMSECNSAVWHSATSSDWNVVGDASHESLSATSLVSASTCDHVPAPATRPEHPANTSRDNDRLQHACTLTLDQQHAAATTAAFRVCLSSLFPGITPGQTGSMKVSKSRAFGIVGRLFTHQTPFLTANQHWHNADQKT